jgi:hypothetical protein
VPRAIHRLIAAALRVVPVHGTIAIHGFGDDEENALRIARAAVERSGSDVRVYLLSHDPERSRAFYRIAAAVRGPGGREPRFVRKNTVRGVWIFLTSRVVFYTHGLFGSPTSGSRRIHVLLGHGHGPKSATPNALAFEYRPDIASTNSDTWGRQVIRELGIVDPQATIVTGNPREDAFDESADRGRLSALGIDPGRPMIVWLPTYRVSDHPAYGGWSDGKRLDTLPRYRESIRTLVRLCAQHQVTLVTKSHILDAQGVSDSWGIPAVSTDSLLAAGLSFYQFLRLSDGMVSDYSSVWVDYLSAGASIGLLMHDLADYERSRGLNEPPLRSVASAIELFDDATIAEFVDSIAGGAVWRGDEQRAVGLAIGFHRGRSRSDAVVDAVQHYADRHAIPAPFDRR